MTVRNPIEKVVTALIIAILATWACLMWDMARQPEDTYLENYYLRQANGLHPR